MIDVLIFWRSKNVVGTYVLCEEAEKDRLRTTNSNLEKETTEKEESAKKAEKLEVFVETAQYALEVVAGERTSIVFVKDSLFDMKNMQNLFNSPIFDFSIKIVYGLSPLHGEPSTFSIPFPQFPSHSSTIEPSKVQEEVPHVRIRSPPPIVKPPSRSV
ncbi:hypothetical protein JHK87_009992 [Glycine soja]|nr:hypothetical protein JHK87_009992 [Glycine soja]